MKKKSKTKSRPAKHISRTTLKVRGPKKVITTAAGRPLTEQQVQKFREILTQKRDDLLAIVQRKKEQEIPDMETGDEADIATQSVEKEMLFELTDSEKQTLDMVEAALRRMEKGVFGQCESCRKPILRMRLDVMPWARYCMPCQSQVEVPTAE